MNRVGWVLGDKEICVNIIPYTLYTTFINYYYVLSICNLRYFVFIGGWICRDCRRWGDWPRKGGLSK